MENNDTKTDYQEIVRAGDQMWEMVEITIGIIFFCLFVWDSCPLFFICAGNFQVSPTWKKYPHPKVPIPTPNPNLTYVPTIQTFWKMAQTFPLLSLPPITQGACELWNPSG